MFLYVLQLSSGKYYVGKTKNIFNRLLQHKQNKGSKWTRKFSVLNLRYLFYSNEDLENSLTLVVMKKYGVTNVRGGKWVREELTKTESEKLQILLQGVVDNLPYNRCIKNDLSIRRGLLMKNDLVS